MYRLILAALLLFVSLAVTSCAKRSHATVAISLSATEPNASAATDQRINLNTARVKDLETLPGIGKGIAERIVEHREKYGPFRRAEHLMMVRGISETRFRAVRQLVTVDQ